MKSLVEDLANERQLHDEYVPYPTHNRLKTFWEDVGAEIALAVGGLGGSFLLMYFIAWLIF
jgi:hypothetical protein